MSVWGYLCAIKGYFRKVYNMSVVWGSSVKWPDTSKDNKALDMAKAELGPGADVHRLLDRAQEIKKALTSSS